MLESPGIRHPLGAFQVTTTRMRRNPVAIVLASMLLAWATLAQAVGFGRVENATVLGQPLDFYATVVLGADESVEPDCIAVEVQSGDSPLPPQAVQVRVVRGSGGAAPRLRVQSTVRIDEPVVTVQLSVSCGTRLTRRFVVLVDPPTYAVPQVVAQAPARDAEPAAPATLPAPVARASDAPATVTRSAPRARDASRASQRNTARRARSSTPPRVVALAPAGGSASPAVAASAQPSASAPSNPSASVQPPRAAARAGAGGSSRLVLDAAGQSAPMSAAAQTASAAAGAASSVSEADAFAAEMARERERLKQLEATVDRLRAEQASAVAAQQAPSAAVVPARVRDTADRAAMSPLIYALAAAVLLLLVAVIVLMLQQARLRREVKWWTEAAVGPDSRLAEPQGAPRVPTPPLPLSPPPPPPRTMPAPMAAPTYDPDPVTLPAAALQQTTPVTLVSPPPPDTVSMGDMQVPARELSVEELMDLEQQADFFVVLGQDEAAVDLLMSMVRSSGGSSPMPYLKLLEIYRRTGERGPYDRIRERFNQRFNGIAPSWEQDPASGLELEGYPDVLAGLQALWPAPLDAAVSLEAMLFRRGGHLPPFDLPAFAELLFLHRLSHDLFEQERSSTGVDLLLPLDSTIDAHMPITLDLQRPTFDPSGLVDFESMPKNRNR